MNVRECVCVVLAGNRECVCVVRRLSTYVYFLRLLGTNIYLSIFLFLQKLFLYLNLLVNTS